MRSDSNLDLLVPATTGAEFERSTYSSTAIRPIDDPHERGKATTALILGTLMLILAASGRTLIGEWSTDYGRSLVLLAVIVYLGIAAQLIGWGARTLASHSSDHDPA